MTVRSRADDLAVLASPHRVAILNLDRLEAPPVVLTGTAADIWQAVDGVRDDTAICQLVAREYGMAVEQVAADVVGCLTALAELGLVCELNGGN